MIVNKIKKIVDALLSPSDQQLQGMQNPTINEANWEFAQGQFFEQLAIEHHSMFKKHSTHSMSDEDPSIHDNRNAMWNFLSAALKGHRDSQYRLGLCYLNGDLGLDKNYTHAQEWLEKAAKQGHPEALRTLMQSYSQIAL